MGKKEKKYACKKQKVDEKVEIECVDLNDEEEKQTKMVCFPGTQGKSGGVSFGGIGVQAGTQETVMICVTENDLEEAVAKKLNTNKDDIDWTDYEDEYEDEDEHECECEFEFDDEDNI